MHDDGNCESEKCQDWQGHDAKREIENTLHVREKCKGKGGGSGKRFSVHKVLFLGSNGRVKKQGKFLNYVFTAIQLHLLVKLFLR